MTDSIYKPHDGAQTVLMLGGCLGGGGKSALIRARLEAAGFTVLVANPRPARTENWIKGWFDELHDLTRVPLFQTPQPSEKRKQLIAQLNRAKAQRNKNLVRDLTRQLEVTP
jgi:predicted ATPase